VEAVRTGYPSPRFLLAYIYALPSGSLTQALLLDCPELVGWTREMAMGADIFDAIVGNTVTTAPGKLRTNLPPHPRPNIPGASGGGKRSAAAPRTVSGLHLLLSAAIDGG
jgi:hypothetical protein